MRYDLLHSIETTNLTKYFGDFVAVHDLNIVIKAGEIYGFLGPNGSGKTTVIKMLCGLLEPTSGSAKVLGYDTIKQGEEIRANIGYMSQQFSLYDDLSVVENMYFYGSIYGLNHQAIEDKIAFFLQKLALSPYQERLAGNLSGGWKRRLAFACAIMHEPKVIFLDEPTAGIDPVARRELWDIFFEYASNGVSFFVTTHYMDEAQRCDSLGYIYLSKLIVNGSLEALENSPTLNPKGYRRAKVLASPITKALKVLKKASFTKEATIFGHAIHILYQEGITQEAMEEYLSQEDIIFESMQSVEASLEDLFVTLTQQSEGV